MAVIKISTHDTNSNEIDLLTADVVFADCEIPACIWLSITLSPAFNMPDELGQARLDKSLYVSFRTIGTTPRYVRLG